MMLRSWCTIVLASVLVALLFSSPGEARKCRRENKLSKCLPSGGTCPYGTLIPNLCNYMGTDSGEMCCIPGGDSKVFSASLCRVRYLISFPLF